MRFSVINGLLCCAPTWLLWGERRMHDSMVVIGLRIYILWRIREESERLLGSSLIIICLHIYIFGYTSFILNCPLDSCAYSWIIVSLFLYCPLEGLGVSSVQTCVVTYIFVVAFHEWFLEVLVKIKPHTSLSRFSLYSANKGNPIKSWIPHFMFCAQASLNFKFNKKLLVTMFLTNLFFSFTVKI